MVGKVERLEPELEVLALGEFEVLQRGEVPGDDPRADYGVAAGIAKGAQRLQLEGCNVEPLSGIALAAVDGYRVAGGVRPITAGASVGAVRSGVRGQREAGRDGED